MWLFLILFTVINACPFDQLDMDKISFETIDEYRTKERPFVLHNAMKEWTFIFNSSRKFVDRFKFMKLKYDTRDDLAAIGVATRTINMSDVYNVEGLSFTYFNDMKQNNKQTEMDQLVNYFPRLEFSERLPTRFKNHKVLSLAKESGGIDFHYHDGTYLALLEGVKEWQIFPHDWERYLEYGHPSKEFDNRIQFIPLICKQPYGTIFYLPARYDHRTVNIGNNFAMAWQETYPTHTPNMPP